MGLFDTIICDYPLPLPDFTKEELEDFKREDNEDLNWEEIEWQTKDLGGMLDVYTIEEDGQIYLRSTNWIATDDETGIKGEEGELQKFERTAEIQFYNIFLGEKHDHWIEFRAIIWKGDLKELELVEYKKEDNSDRMKYQREMLKEIKKQESKSKIYGGYRFLLNGTLGIVRYVAALIANLTWKIERWLP